MTTIHEQIDECMTERGVSRRELARRLGVTPAAISNMLRPGHNFTVGTLERITAALGVDLAINIVDDGEPLT